MLGAMLAFMLLRTLVGALGLHHGMGFAAGFAAVAVYFAIDARMQTRRESAAQQHLQSLVSEKKAKSRKSRPGR